MRTSNRIYLPIESNLHRFVFYSTLIGQDDLESRQRKGYYGPDAYNAAADYLTSGLHDLTNDKDSESSYQQALNLLKQIADNELTKEKNFLINKTKTSDYMPQSMKNAILALNNNFDYLNFLRILNEYYLNLKDLKQKIDNEYDAMKVISDSIEKASTRYHNFQTDKSKKRKKLMLTLSPKDTTTYSFGNKKIGQRSRLSKEGESGLAAALKASREKNLTLSDLDKKAYQDLSNYINKILNEKYKKQVYDALSDPIKQQNLIKILDYIVITFYQGYAGVLKKKEFLKTYKQASSKKEKDEVLNNEEQKFIDDLEKSIKKAFDFFNKNLKMIEDLSENLLGKTESLYDFRARRQDMLEQLGIISEDIGVKLKTAKGISQDSKKWAKVESQANEGDLKAKEALEIKKEIENGKRIARKKGTGTLSVQAEYSQALRSAITGALSSRRKGQRLAKDDTLSFHLSYTPPEVDLSYSSALDKVNTILSKAQDDIEFTANNGKMDTKSLKGRFSAQKKIYANLEKNLTALKKELGLAKEDLNLFIEHGSTKEYTFFNNTIGVHGGALGENSGLISAINNIDLMAEKGGITIRDKEWLIFAAMNCAKHLIGADFNVQEPLENYLSLIAGALMFEDADMIMEGVKANIASTTQQSLQHIHIYQVNGYYFPLSYILNLTWESLKELSNFLVEASHSGNQVHIINKSHWKSFANENITKETWTKEAESTINSTTITMTFLAGFLDILDSLRQ